MPNLDIAFVPNGADVWTEDDENDDTVITAGSGKLTVMSNDIRVAVGWGLNSISHIHGCLVLESDDDESFHLDWAGTYPILLLHRLSNGIHAYGCYDTRHVANTIGGIRDGGGYFRDFSIVTVVHSASDVDFDFLCEILAHDAAKDYVLSPRNLDLWSTNCVIFPFCAAMAVAYYMDVIDTAVSTLENMARRIANALLGRRRARSFIAAALEALDTRQPWLPSCDNDDCDNDDCIYEHEDDYSYDVYSDREEDGCSSEDEEPEEYSDTAYGSESDYESSDYSDY